MPIRWLTTEEVMKHLRIGSKHTLRKYRTQGLPAHQVGGQHLFDIDEVDAWVRSRCSDLTPGRNDQDARDRAFELGVEIGAEIVRAAVREDAA